MQEYFWVQIFRWLGIALFMRRWRAAPWEQGFRSAGKALQFSTKRWRTAPLCAAPQLKEDPLHLGMH